MVVDGQTSRPSVEWSLARPLHAPYTECVRVWVMSDSSSWAAWTKQHLWGLKQKQIKIEKVVVYIYAARIRFKGASLLVRIGKGVLGRPRVIFDFVTRNTLPFNTVCCAVKQQT